MRRISPAIAVLGFIGLSLGLSANPFADAVFTSFDPAGSTITLPAAINPAGQIVGSYYDGLFVHSFLRNPGGAISSFDAPGAGPGIDQGTYADSINAVGQIVGVYVSGPPEARVFQSFLRNPDGAITSFEVAWSSDTEAQAINSAGQIVGFWGTDLVHGFVRGADGTVVSFDAPGAGTGFNSGTVPISINSAGKVAGYYDDAERGIHGFVRTSNGAITAFDAPRPLLPAIRGLCPC
jgi:hypothetical protein